MIEEAEKRLADDIKYFESENIACASLDASSPIDLTSGGTRAKGGPLPALYANPIRAVDEFWDFLRFMVPLSRDGISYRWIERPKLNKYQITMTDPRGTHRVVEDRYCVESRMVISIK